MKTLLSAVRADVSAQAGDLRVFWLLGLGMVGFAILVGGEDHLTAVPAVFALIIAFLPSRLFAQDERSNLPTMFSILPVSRSQFVLARYLVVAGTGAISIALGLLTHTIAKVFLPSSGEDSPMRVFVILGLASLAVCAVCAIQMPVFFGFGVGRMGLVGAAFPMLLVFAVTGIANSFPDQAARIMNLLDSAWTLPVCLIMSAALLVISAVFSLLLYARRDL